MKSSTPIDSLAILAAIAIHASVIAGAHFLPPVRELLGDPSGSNEGTLQLVSVETIPDDEAPANDLESSTKKEVSEVEPAPRSEAPGALVSRGDKPAKSDSGDASDTRREAGEARSGSSENAAPPSGGAPSPEQYDSPAAAPPPIGLSGLMGSPVWTMPGAILPDRAAPAPTTAPERAAIDPTVANRVIASTLRSKDKKTGVDVPAGSVVAGTVATVMRTVDVPHNTRATFEVKLGPGGKVLGARVVSASAGDASQWDGAAKNVAASLAKQTLPLGPDADQTGVTVRVTVTQKHVFPSGTAQTASIKPKCANGFINDIVDAADKEPLAKAQPKVPMFQDEYGRPCIPVGMEGLTDVTNLGAQKQIQVESSFQVIIPGQLDLPADIHPVNTDAPWVERGKEGPRPTLPQKVRKQMRDREKKK